MAMIEIDPSESAPPVDQIQASLVYAEALWHIAAKRNILEETVEELASFVLELLNKDSVIEQVFSLGVITSSERVAFVDKVFTNRVSDLLFDFLRILARNDRLYLVRAVVFHLKEMWHKRMGIARVVVHSARPLDADEKARLGEMVESRFNVKPYVVFQVDPKILGGLTVRIGDTVYDASVHTSLRRLKDNIQKRYAHEIQSERDPVGRPDRN